MCACSFDMMFTFVYTGWEGTANDSRVFVDAVTRPENKFPFPHEGMELLFLLLHVLIHQVYLYHTVHTMQLTIIKINHRLLLCCGCWIYKHAGIFNTLSG